MRAMHTLVHHSKLESKNFAPEIWLLELSPTTPKGLGTLWPELFKLLEKSRVCLLIRFFALDHLSTEMIQDLIKLEELACEPELRIYWCDLSSILQQFLKEAHLDAIFEIHSTRSKALANITAQWQEEKRLFVDMDFEIQGSGKG
ncbi:hypothetical protein COW64_08155 [bacterium (Candidatus Blackallbacteria) CG18_big_fil_WC_8_21_14_2_50_49_26]|nr:MAG: hypothetical protein COW64_08155 [bacterium (Candidatus Blackallbacteria) CG18_big_fil_WC_8_21_14_2_50_49_26]